jgi:predicted SnoaL-like aldol condensation-catalyzing enzyme
MNPISLKPPPGVSAMKSSSVVCAAACAAFAVGLVASVFADAPVTKDSKGLVAVGLLDTVFNQRKVQQGFDEYVGDTYKQHNPYAADGKQAAIDFLSKFLATGAEYKYDFKHVYVDGRIVVVHSHVTRGKDDRGSAVIDIFRLDNRNKIVEHWDVLQPIPEKSANDNTMF